MLGLIVNLRAEHHSRVRSIESTIEESFKESVEAVVRARSRAVVDGLAAPERDRMLLEWTDLFAKSAAENWWFILTWRESQQPHMLEAFKSRVGAAFRARPPDICGLLTDATNDDALRRLHDYYGERFRELRSQFAQEFGNENLTELDAHVQNRGPRKHELYGVLNLGLWLEPLRGIEYLDLLRTAASSGAQLSAIIDIHACPNVQNRAWDAAVSLVGWTSTDGLRPVHSAIKSGDEVAFLWGLQQDDFRRLTERNGDALFVMTDEIRGAAKEHAAHQAYAQASAAMNAVGILTGRTESAGVSNVVVLRDKTQKAPSFWTGDVLLTRLRKDYLNEGDLARLQRLVRRALTTAKSETPLARRLKSSLHFLDVGLKATTFQECYTGLWIALEALFGNLESDNGISIEASVTYRAALSATVPEWLHDATYGVARSAMAAEFSSLYNLRCRIVHDGVNVPPQDEVFLQNLQDLVVSAILNVYLNWSWFHLTSVEEWLAWNEEIQPASMLVRRPRRR